jgi:hypothetical protein
MVQTGAATVRKEIVVEAPIKRAFTVVTYRFGDFKPPEHNLLGAPVAETPTRTRVELEHRHIDRHSPGWEAVTDGVNGPEGSPLYLDRYATLLKEGR